MHPFWVYMGDWKTVPQIPQQQQHQQQQHFPLPDLSASPKIKIQKRRTIAPKNKVYLPSHRRLQRRKILCFFVTINLVVFWASQWGRNPKHIRKIHFLVLIRWYPHPVRWWRCRSTPGTACPCSGDRRGCGLGDCHPPPSPPLRSALPASSLFSGHFNWDSNAGITILRKISHRKCEIQDHDVRLAADGP